MIPASPKGMTWHKVIIILTQITNLSSFVNIALQPGSVFTNHSQEHSLSFSQRFHKSECNTTSDQLNHMENKTKNVF